MALGKIVVPLVSIFLVVGVVIGVDVVVKKSDDGSNEFTSTVSMKALLTSICQLTTYKEACATSLEPAAKNITANPTDYILSVVEATLKEINKSREATEKVVVDKDKDEYHHVAVEDCKHLLEYAIDMLQASISVVVNSDIHTFEDHRHELWSWMTGVYAFQATCIDQIKNQKYKYAIVNGMLNAIQLTHNAVNILAEFSNVLKAFNVPLAIPQRRLLSMEDGYPSWFEGADRKLLAQQGAGGMVPDVVVAKDGSGKYKTIKEGLTAYPPNHEGRFTIYVKAGVYDEQVIVDKKKPNIFMYGDGIGKTIVTGKKNFGLMNIGTMQTATFANEGQGFIARAITFRNEAGPKGHQAVAFRSVGDRAALFDCSFEGFQDTLYYQSLRQFYRNCHIYGTIDFIFGMGDAVIQDSEIIVRKPLPHQFNTVTADGREIPKGSNGLVIQNCSILPDKFLETVKFENPTYLGRPWKKDAITVVMQSLLGDFIQPEGWKVWESKEGKSNHKTCEMYEFDNRGPGNKTDQRNKLFLKFKVLSSAEASKYTPGPFLKGDQWLPQTGIPFRLGL